jgi:hypothetical protein
MTIPVAPNTRSASRLSFNMMYKWMCGEESLQKRLADRMRDWVACVKARQWT